jgi:hypothetical protein
MHKVHDYTFFTTHKQYREKAPIGVQKKARLAARAVGDKSRIEMSFVCVRSL